MRRLEGFHRGSRARLQSFGDFLLVVHIELSTADIECVLSAPAVVYQAARWIKRFHQAHYAHIGWTDHPGGIPFSRVLHYYGFVRVPLFDYNNIRLLLNTYGPLMITGMFAHLEQDETALPARERRLIRVTTYQAGDHAIVLNGYWDGFTPRLLYRDPAHPARQFALDLSRFWDLLDSRAGLYYLHCMLPKPCAHLRGAVPAERRPTPQEK